MAGRWFESRSGCMKKMKAMSIPSHVNAGISLGSLAGNRTQPEMPVPAGLRCRPESGRYGRRIQIISLFLMLVLAATSGCSIRTFVAKKAGDVLAEGGTVYARDDDIKFVGEAIPFGLKTMEGLLAEAPDHRPLLVATARGFTQYAHVYVDLAALEVEPSDPRRARHLRQRASRLYLRAHRYAIRALELRVPEFRQKLREEPESAVIDLRASEVSELYWAAVSLGAAIAADKQNMDLVADLHLVEPMIQRALELDDTFGEGAIHQFLISFEASRAGAMGGSIEQARWHFERAMELADGRQVSPLVSLAENVATRMHDRQAFMSLLQRALEYDVDRAPSHRLANLVAQKRARILLSRVDDFFIGG